MSKHTYTFEYLVSSPARLIGQKLFRKVRAMNETEAQSRFNRWVALRNRDEEFKVSFKRISGSDDTEWLTRHGRIFL